jgi:hypothetical protein
MPVSTPAPGWRSGRSPWGSAIVGMREGWPDRMRLLCTMRFPDIGSRTRRVLPARRHWRLSLACAVAAGVAGCASAGTPGYDTAALARTIRHDLEAHPGFRVVAVSCPKQAKLAKGVVVDCSVTLHGGHVVRMKATQLDDKGTVHLVASEMLADNVEHGIVATLAPGGKRVRAVCPQHVSVVVGKTFNCTVINAAGRKTTAGVTIVDSDGGFRLRFHGGG